MISILYQSHRVSSTLATENFHEIEDSMTHHLQLTETGLVCHH